MRPLFLLGRALVGGYFVYSGLNHFQNREMLSGYAKSKHVPAAEAAVLGTGALMAAGGVSVLTGLRPKAGVAAIATFLIGVTPMMHDFWNVSDPQQRMPEQTNFLKNMALLGAALMLTEVPEPWPMGVEQIEPVRRIASSLPRVGRTAAA